MRYYLYSITNTINNKKYIGQTVNPDRRWRDHKWLSEKKPEQYIHRAMRENGIENFVFTIIDFAFNQHQIDCLEQNYICQHNTRNSQYGYNLAPGGKGNGSGENHPNYGKKHSSEAIEKRRKSMEGKFIGIHFSPDTEFKPGHVGYNKGGTLPEETKNKISKANKGKKRTPEAIEKVRRANLGRTAWNKGKSHPKVSGEKNINAKLTQKKVDKIRSLYTDKLHTLAELSRLFNVSITTIHNIVSNKIWKI